MRPALSAVALSLLLLAPAASAQRTDYRVLLPVFFPEAVAGAYGSQWKTTYAVHNPTPHAFHVDWCPSSTDPNYAACSLPLYANAHLAPGDTETTLPPFSLHGNELQRRGGPRLLYISEFVNPPGSQPNPAALSFALRAFDVSRSASNAGTEIPVVRQEQFRKSTTSLLNVPTDPKFRLTLRLYETNLKVAGFTIRLFDQSTNALLGSRDMVLSWHFEHHWLRMFEPPHLQLGDVTELLPRGTPLPQTLRIEIEPRTPQSEFWAFVSITNNDTQHLTLVTPQ